MVLIERKRPDVADKHRSLSAAHVRFSCKIYVGFDNDVGFGVELPPYTRLGNSGIVRKDEAYVKSHRSPTQVAAEHNYIGFIR